MRLIIDTSVLVGELIRERGRQILNHPALELFIAESTWSEVEHELPQRLAALVQYGRLTKAGAGRLQSAILGLAETRILVVPSLFYNHLENEARSRIPRDADDWPTVAVALVIGCTIWTADCDFIGCGLPTWTTDTLLPQLTLRL